MAVRRANPHLNEFIELMDDHFLTSGGSIPEAWTRIGKTEREFMTAEVARCRRDPRYYLENYHTIRTEQDGLKTLSPFWDSQEMFYEEVVTMMAANRPVKVMILKARQLGLSTICEGMVFWKTIFTPVCNTLIVATDTMKADDQFEMSRLAYDCLPWWMQPETRYDQKGRILNFDRKDDFLRKVSPGLKSNIYVEAANKSTGVARGKTIRACHMCLSDRNLVIDCGGHATSIADVQPGCYIQADQSTHVMVKAVSAKPAWTIYEGAEHGYLVTPWCNSSFPIEGTGNHRVLACELPYGHGKKVAHKIAMKELRDLTLADSLVVPVLPICECRMIGDMVLSDDDILPPREMTVGGTNGHGGKVSRWRRPDYGRDFGFAVGLYLAEGSALDNKLAISLDEDEQNLADRFAAAIGAEYGKPQKNGDSRTRIYYFHNTALAEWFHLSLGAGDDKKMPNWLWHCGREMLAGVVEGLILGDGHLHKWQNTIQFSTTRASLAIAIREAVASLGHGYGCITDRPAGSYYGRNCQQQWTVTFTDIPNRSMRSEYKWENLTPSAELAGRHWYYSEDKTQIYVRLRNIERVDLDMVYDIEVDSEDHVYRLPGALTHNSELATWEGGGATLTQQIFPTMNADDVLAFMESTAEGRSGFWYRFWCDTIEGKTDWHPIFIPFFRVRKYSKPLTEGVPFIPTQEEDEYRHKIKEETNIEITDEVLNWRRMKISVFVSLEGDEFGFRQEYPSNWMEAFQGKGICAFPKRLLYKVLETTCIRPKFIGSINYDREARIARTQLRDVLSNEVIHNPTDDDCFWVWEKPRDDGAYYVAADVAEGIEGKDFSVVQVLRIGVGLEPDEQVAEWRGWINPTPFAYIVSAIASWYGMAEVAVECNNVGKVTNNEIFRVIEYDNVYRWKHIDKVTNIYTNYIGWETNWKTRTALIAKMNEALLDRTIILHSDRLIDEMMDFSYDEDGEGKAQGRATKDDRVMAMMIANYCAHESNYGKQAMIRPVSGTGGEVNVFFVLDKFNRKIGEFTDRAAAFELLNKTIGGSMVRAAQDRDYANTLYSPIHQNNGIRSRMYYDMGYAAEAIDHESVKNETDAEAAPTQDDPQAWLYV